MELSDKVRSALDNAKENGYDMLSLSPNEIAWDLCTYDGDLEGEDMLEVSEIVNSIRISD
jgi:hypothetical protein